MGVRAPLRIVLVGTGLAAGMHAQALTLVPEAHLLGAVGTSPERSRAFAARLGLPRTYADLGEALSDPDVEAVHLCTPPHTHLQVATRVAAAGRHLLIDKPLARTVAEGEAIVARCARAGVRLAGLFQHRFIPQAQALRQAVAEGRLGRIVLADCAVKWWRDPEYYASSSWRARRATEGGGALINQAIHSIDLLQWFTGPVVSVSGHVATARHAIETEDVGVAVLRTADGALGVIEGSTAAWPGFPERVALHGTQGSACLDEGRRRLEWQLQGEPRRVDAAGETQGNAADPAAISYEAHAAAFADFVGAVRDGRPPAVDGEGALAALRIVEAIYRSSADGGRPVSLR